MDARIPCDRPERIKSPSTRIIDCGQILERRIWSLPLIRHRQGRPLPLRQRPASLELDEHGHTKWLGLEVRRHDVQDAEHATVEFVARYRMSGRGHRLHETNRFIRVEGA